MSKEQSKENPILYVVLNGELNMSPGKATAQAVHAAMLLEGNYPGLFVAAYKRTVVVLEAQNGEAIKNMMEYLQGADIFCAYYIDEISEQGGPYQITALAVEPIDHDDIEKRSMFRDFSLYGSSAGTAWRCLSDYTKYFLPWYAKLTISWLNREAKK